jgi:hypothetical protein
VHGKALLMKRENINENLKELIVWFRLDKPIE